MKIGGMLAGGIMVRGLSGGEKRRLAICCATITKPDILFADEPTSGKLYTIRLLKKCMSKLVNLP